MPFQSALRVQSFESARGKLHRLSTRPLRIERFRLWQAAREAALWLRATLDGWCRPLGTSVQLESDDTLTLRW